MAQGLPWRMLGSVGELEILFYEAGLRQLSLQKIHAGNSFFLDRWKTIMGRGNWYFAVTGEDGGDQRKSSVPVQVLTLTAIQSLTGRTLPSVRFSFHARSSQLWLNTSVTQHLSKNTTAWIPPWKTLLGEENRIPIHFLQISPLPWVTGVGFLF